MKGKNSFVLYKSWRSYFELLEEPELITELVYAIFDLADGKEATVTNNRVRSALKAIEPKMKEDLERFKAKCDKNREAAQKRWKDADGMRSHTDAMQMDGDTESDSVSDSDTDSDTDDDTDIDILAMPCQEVPSVADVIEAAHYRDIDMTAEDAQEFLDYFYRDRKGLIDGEPIRNWRNLLKTWDNHKLVETGSVMEQSCEGYEVYKKLPTDVKEDINHDQEMFEGKLTKATAKKVTAITTKMEVG